jgi:hypothetical protein
MQAVLNEQPSHQRTSPEHAETMMRAALGHERSDPAVLTAHRF